MLTLKDINLDNEYIEAYYVPENDTVRGYAKVHRAERNVYDVDYLDGYGQMYSSMALAALREIRDKLSSGKITENEIPKEKRIVWY